MIELSKILDTYKGDKTEHIRIATGRYKGYTKLKELIRSI